jgi:hypothetical protein
MSFILLPSTKKNAHILHPLTLLATWPKDVEQLARNFLFDPYKVKKAASNYIIGIFYIDLFCTALHANLLYHTFRFRYPASPTIV